MALLATVIETKALTETILASAISGIGVTAAFSVVIFGATRAVDLRNQDRPMAAAAAFVLMAAGLAVTIGGVALGLIVVTT